MSATQSWARMLNNMGFTPDPAKAPLATIGVRGGGLETPRHPKAAPAVWRAVLPKHRSLGRSRLG